MGAAMKPVTRKRLAWAYGVTLVGVLAILFDAIHPAQLTQLRGFGVALTFVGSFVQIWAMRSHLGR